MKLLPASLSMLVSMFVMLCACGTGSQGPVACTAIAAASVTVNVLDGQGRTQRDAHVTFTLDGGASQEALCEGGAKPSGGDCGSWVTNYEQAGDYVITATSADGKRKAQLEVKVTADECHVSGKVVTLTLPD